VARFIADQRTLYRVPVAFTCLILGISVSWFYKCSGRGPSKRRQRRAKVDAAVAAEFAEHRGLHGSPRLFVDLREKGWTVSERTVADWMRRQGLVARVVRRGRGLTKRDRDAAVFPDLVRRDFTASRVNERWVGDITEIPTAAGKLYLATVIDLYSRRLLAAATSLHPDAELACAVIRMAAAVHGGKAAIEGVIFHADRGSTYTAGDLTRLCTTLGIPPVDGPGRVVLRQRGRRSVVLPAGVGGALPATSSATQTTPGRSSWSGATASTTPPAGTPAPG
jgi:transposase InsO family protein